MRTMTQESASSSPEPHRSAAHEGRLRSLGRRSMTETTIRSSPLKEPWVDRLLGDVRRSGGRRHRLRNGTARATAGSGRSDRPRSGLFRRNAGACASEGRRIEYRLSHITIWQSRCRSRTESFDRVVCGLVIDHIADLGGLFREMHRVCRPSGFVVVSVMHPAMMLRGVQARFRDPASGREIRPASCTHQLSDYIMAAAQAGFAFDHLSEQSVDEALACRLERARKYLGWPMLFLMRLRPETKWHRPPAFG